MTLTDIYQCNYEPYGTSFNRNQNFYVIKNDSTISKKSIFKIFDQIPKVKPLNKLQDNRIRNSVLRIDNFNNL